MIRFDKLTLKGLLALQRPLVETNNRNLLRDTDLLRLCLLLFWKRDLEYAVFVIGTNLFFIHCSRDGERPAESAVRPLDSMIVFVFRLFLEPPLSLQCP